MYVSKFQNRVIYSIVLILVGSTMFEFRYEIYVRSDSFNKPSVWWIVHDVFRNQRKNRKFIDYKFQNECWTFSFHWITPARSSAVLRGYITAAGGRIN